MIGLYNPASGRRTRQIVEAQAIIRRHRAGTTPVALVKSAYRKLQQVDLTDLDHFLEFEIGMLTTVLVGSSQTFVFEGYMVTPRGYTNKYTWEGETLPGQTPGRSLVTAGAADGGAVSRVGRLAGALLAETGGAYFLVGNLKRPCDFAAAGFEPPAAPIDALARPFVPLRRVAAPLAVAGAWLDAGAGGRGAGAAAGRAAADRAQRLGQRSAVAADPGRGRRRRRRDRAPDAVDRRALAGRDAGARCGRSCATPS